MLHIFLSNNINVRKASLITQMVEYTTWHSTKKPETTMLTYPWKCTVLHCNHLGNTGKPLVLMTRHFDYCPSASESSAPVVSRCFPGGYNAKQYISRGRLAWWLLAFLHSVGYWAFVKYDFYIPIVWIYLQRSFIMMYSLVTINYCYLNLSIK